MLQKLTVENYALIEKLDMELSSQLNIITGQTGAGKSILLGAMGLVLGNRADTSALKDNERNCVVEGIFCVGDYGLESFFEENDLEYDKTTIIRRVITPAGKSRVYVNDMPVQLAVVKELGIKLIDIHSQHQSLMLGDKYFRVRAVDSIAGNRENMVEYTYLYTQLKSVEKELARVVEEAENNKRDEEYVRFQYEQLESVNLQKGELEELELEQKELSNTEQIGESLGGSVNVLADDEMGVLMQLKGVDQSLLKIKDVYPLSAELIERVRCVMVELRDVEQTLTNEVERVEANPKRLAEVDKRLDTIYSLFQKHRVVTIEELLDLQTSYEQRLSAITSSEEQISKLTEKIEVLTVRAEKFAQAISQKRKKAAVELSKGVESLFARLGMGGARFECIVTPLEELSSNGIDGIEFLFASTPKHTPQALEKIASGGEMSRVMLCLKALVARSAKLPTIIFDEVDTGVSGRIADITGEIIAELSESMQVVNITHLPQVASKGKTHFQVYKDSVDSRTHLRLLSPQERVDEIAKMLSGTTVTAAAIEQAKELIGN